MSVGDCFGDSLMVPTLSSVDGGCHLAQLKEFLVISSTHLHMNLFIDSFFGNSFLHSTNVYWYCHRLGSPGADTEIQFEEQNMDMPLYPACSLPG